MSNTSEIIMKTNICGKDLILFKTKNNEYIVKSDDIEHNFKTLNEAYDYYKTLEEHLTNEFCLIG